MFTLKGTEHRLTLCEGRGSKLGQDIPFSLRRRRKTLL